MFKVTSLAAIFVISLGSAALLSGCVLVGPTAAEPSSSQGLKQTTATVERVVDGDTLIVREGKQRIRVRILGIDAPESVKPDTPVECYGAEASTYLKDLLPAKSTVQLELDPSAGDKDEYGRSLRAIFTQDGTNVAVAIAGAGTGKHYVYQRTPSRYAPQIAAAEQKAKQSKKGLWGAC